MGEEPNNNNLEPNEEPQNESQTPAAPEGTDPLDSNFYQIGDGNLNLRFITLNTIEFIKAGNDLSKPTINLALGNGSGANTVVYDTQQQMESATDVVDKMFAYRTDLNGLFIRINNEWKQISSVSVQDDGLGNISYVTLHYAEKDKNETITGTWTFNNNSTFKENTTFEKNVNANQVIADTIHSDGASSGLEGSGYMVYKDLNDKYVLDIDKIFVRETLEAQEYKINKVTATNGTLYVSDASKISNLEATVYNIPVSDANYFTTFTGNTYKVYIEENVFSQYDVLECQYVENNLNVKNYQAVVLNTNYTTPEEGFIYIKLKQSGTQPKIDDILVRINNLVNNDRKGIIYLTSSMLHAPYIEIKGSDNHKVKLGNLDGTIFNEDVILSGYGLFADNVYLKGTFKLQNNNSLLDANGTSIIGRVGNLESQYSLLSADSEGIRAAVINKVGNDIRTTGIDITTGEIKVNADNFSIYSPDDINKENALFGYNRKGLFFKGVVNNPSVLFPLETVELDQNENEVITEYNYLELNLDTLNNIQVYPRVIGYHSGENGANEGRMLEIVLPGFDYVQNESVIHNDETYMHIIDKYGNGNEYDLNKETSYSDDIDDGTEFEIYHQYAPIYMYPYLHLNLETSNNDSIFHLSTLILADYKLSGNSNVEYEKSINDTLDINPYISNLNLFMTGCNGSHIAHSSGWIVSKKGVSKAILLPPGCKAKFKSVKCNNLSGKFASNAGDPLYHSIFWLLENSDEFITTDISFEIYKANVNDDNFNDDGTLHNNSQSVINNSSIYVHDGLLIPKDILDDMSKLDSKYIKLVLEYNNNNKLSGYLWSLENRLNS